MAIYNDVATKITAGTNISFISDPNTGAIVISSTAGPAQSTLSAIAIYADTSGNLSNSNVLVDSSNNISSVNTLNCNCITFASSAGPIPPNMYESSLRSLSLIAPTNMFSSISYVLPEVGDPGSLLAINTVVDGTAILNWVNGSSGGIIAVQGTPGFITSSGGSAPVINIDPTYAGQSTISTTGIITTGTWNATPITVAYGGTGATGFATNALIAGNGTSALQTIANGTSGQVLKSNGNNGVPSWITLTENDVTGLTSNLAACEKLSNKGTANGYCGLGVNALIDLTNLPNIPESKITNLISDLANCEKTANKNVANGYCPLDSNSVIPIENIPLLPESIVANLITDLNACEKTANKNVANGYCGLDSNAYVLPGYISPLNQEKIVNLVADLAACEKIIHKGVASGYCGLDINAQVPLANIPSLPESTVNNLTVNLENCEKIANKNASDGYCPLDSHSCVPLTNLSSSVITNANIVSPLNNQVLQYNASSSKWINSTLTLTTDLGSLSDVSITSPSNNQFLIYNSSNSKWSNEQGDHTTLSNIGTNTHAQIDSFISSKSQASGLASLDSTGKLANLQLPLNAITTINGLTTSNNSLTINLTNLNDVSVSTLTVGQVLMYENPKWTAVTLSITNLGDLNISSPSEGQGIIFNGTQNKWINKQIDHTTLSNIGTNTHAQIDSFISSKGQASGLASLNSSGYLVNTQLPANVITSINSLTTTDNSLTLHLHELNNVSITTPSTGQVLEFNGTNWVNASLSSLTYLSSLSDCAITSPTTNQLLQYNGTKWVNATISSSTALASLTDCSVSGVANDQLLVYTSASSLNKWTPYTLYGATFNDGAKTITISNVAELASLTDCTINTPVTNQLLQFNGTKWVNATVSFSTSLSSLTDCSVSGVTNDQILVYTTASSLNKWAPYTLSGVTFNDTTKTITVAASGVTSISGTTNQITVTGTTTPVISIDTSYAGQSSITTLGTVTSATWNAGIIGGTYGGTGVNNGTKTITLGGNITTAGALTLSGAYSTTLTVTGTTSLTLPTSGTIVASSNSQTNNYSLISNGSSASWQQISHAILSNIGTNTHAQIDTFIGKFNISSPVSGQFLGYNGTSWINTGVSAFTLNSGAVSTFDLSLINSPASYGQTLFDGNYIYYIPSSGTSSVFIRYDIKKPFGISTSYETFNSSSVSASTVGYNGGVFDGRYCYFSPSHAASTSYFLRYDTFSSFTDANSYSYFNLKTLNASVTNFNPCVFDGRYVYTFGYSVGCIVQYDTTQSFTSSSSYAIYMLSGYYFYFATFDGRYVYGCDQNGWLVRYDPTLSLTNSGSYTYVQFCPTGGFSCIFDGRFIYTGAMNSAKVYRYDPTASFVAGSFTSVDLASVGCAGYISDFSYDGRYLYILNYGPPQGLTVYDTTLPFTSLASYSFFNFGLGASQAYYRGFSYDGAFLYLSGTQIRVNKSNINYLTQRTKIKSNTLQNSLGDVQISYSSLTNNNDVLVYNSSSNKWKNLSAVTTYKKLYLSPTTSSGSTMTSIPNTVAYGYQFPYSTQNAPNTFVAYSFCMPFDYKLNTAIALKFILYADASNSNTVSITLRSDSAGTNDQTLVATFSSSNYLVVSKQYTVYTLLNSGVNSCETPINFQISRGYTSGDYTGNIYLVGINAIYSINSIGSSSVDSKI